MFRNPHPHPLFARLVIILLLGTCPVFGTGWKQLHGHVPEAVKKLSPISRLAATNELHLAIGVPLRDPAGLDKFLADVYDPASPSYRHFLMPAEFTARFSATPADYAAVKDFALTNGFKISGEHGNRLLLDVTAQASDVERAFHFKLNKYQHPTEAREFFAPDAEPTVDATLAIIDIQGLSDYSRPHPKLHKMDLKPVAPKTGSAPDGYSYFGDDFRNAYASGTTLTGAGQQVGLLQFDGYYPSDITAYATAAGGGRTNIVIQRVATDSYNGTPTSNGNGEVSLDIEMAMAMAPGLAKIVVFEASPTTGNANTILAAMVNATNAAIKQFSSSWGWSGGPNTTTENYFKQMATQGQSYFNASGDGDAFVNGSNNDVNNSSQTTYPSGSPNITQVGGTELTMNGNGASYLSESVWNDRTVNPNGGNWGSSGGVSTNAMPVWQQGISMAANGGSVTTRNIPDVALTADYCYVNEGNGSSGSYGGTSCAAPLWAGFMALVNQQMAAVTGSATNSVGFINPAVYEIARESIYNLAFHDTASGDNTWSSSPNLFYAVPGYDLCTGLGTPGGTNLINALASPDSLVVISNFGFSATGKPGGPFSPASQNFVLTNSGAASLDWVIGNPSAWLTVSSGGGTLAGGSSVSVTVSVGSGTTNLNPGTYSASLWFSNVTTQVAHARNFTLLLTDPLVLLTTNGFTAAGAVGGSFTPGSQVVVFTNVSASAVAWSLINTSAWLSVSSGSGSLGGNSSVSVIVATNANTATLASNIYNATLVLSNQASHLTQNVSFSAVVGANIVQNGGFETGDFTGWTLSGNNVSTSVTTSSSYVHSGTYGVEAGPSGSPVNITQNLPTYPGQTYQLSFWLDNPKSGNGGGTQSFQAIWNGTTVYSTNFTAKIIFSWINLKYLVTASVTNTVLQFVAQNNPDYFGLDDVTVTPVNLPVITQSPVSQTNLVGSNVVFTAAAAGTPPLAYQWRTNGVNLANGSIVSGATSSVLTFTGITVTNAGNYTLVVTNGYGAITSSIAALTVVSPPSFTGNVTSQTVECGANTNNFSITAAGTAPLSIQWKLDGSPVAGATNASFGLTNLFTSSHTVTVTVTNLSGSVSSNATLTVRDTRPPVITILGGNPLTNELGAAFTDPGVTANDLCAGALPVVTNNSVNVGAVGTYLLKYVATDGVNSATNTRTVIVRDTVPPVISWSFTNLVLAAGTNLTASMPNVTGGNFILATDLSGTVLVTQSPTNNFPLPLGTNAVLLTVADPSGNTAYSTNRIIVAASTNSASKISSPAVLPGSVTLQLNGGYGATYVLEGTGDLTSGNWSPLATNTLGVTGGWQFTDFGVTNNPSRFYRLRLVQ